MLPKHIVRTVLEFANPPIGSKEFEDWGRWSELTQYVDDYNFDDDLSKRWLTQCARFRPKDHWGGLQLKEELGFNPDLLDCASKHDECADFLSLRVTCLPMSVLERVRNIERFNRGNKGKLSRSGLYEKAKDMFRNAYIDRHMNAPWAMDDYEDLLDEMLYRPSGEDAIPPRDVYIQPEQIRRI